MVRVTNDQPPLTPVERARLTTAILAPSTGIFGAEICQVCGKVGTFSGWAGAMGSRHYVGSAFVANGHGHDRQSSEAVLRGRPERFCSLCGTSTEPENARLVEHSWLCRTCAGELPEDAAADLLGQLARRRYLDLCDDETLRRWGNSLLPAAQPPRAS